MDKNIQIFNNDNFGSVRTVTISGEPWFVAKDVCDLFESLNRNRIMKQIDEDDKGYTQMTTPGGVQKLAVVNEPGLYTLLFAMQPQKSRGISSEEVNRRIERLHRFKCWITHDVIPSIRKHGLYAADELLNNPDLFIATLQKLKAEREKIKALEIKNAQDKQIIAELRPKASYYDLILQNRSVMSITNISKDYGLSARAFNKMLHELGVQFKQGKTWFLYQQYANLGYTQSKTHAIDAERSVMHTYWTPKGRLFLYDLLKNEKGILPVIERNQCA